MNKRFISFSVAVLLGLAAAQSATNTTDPVVTDPVVVDPVTPVTPAESAESLQKDFELTNDGLWQSWD